MTDIKAKRITNFWDDPINPGEYIFYVAYTDRAKRIGMLFMCPCGCGERGSLDFRKENKPRWNWDDNEESPTLTPSVLRTSGCKWHGYLTDGVWEEC